MAVVPLKTVTKLEEVGDISDRLPTLQFESALSEEEKKLIILRKRSHALTVFSIAQATHFVLSLNEARQIRAELKTPKKRKANRLLQEVAPRDPILIGIIGCGRIGTQLANSLLTFGEVNPDELKISTRRPESADALQQKGVKVVHNNTQVSSSVHVLFLTVLPSQIYSVVEEIKGTISPRCTVYTFVTSLPVKRLKQVLDFNNIIKPEHSWKEDNADNTWDLSKDVLASLEVSDVVEHTCPLSLRKNECVISTSEKLSEACLYAFINMCSQLHLSREDTVDVINAVLLGHTSPSEERIQETDITRAPPDSTGLFPRFDLSIAAINDTPVLKKLKNNTAVREAYVKRYCAIFQQYMDWKKVTI